MIVSKFKPSDFDDIQLDGIVEPMTESDYELGKSLVMCQYFENGGIGNTGRDAIGNVLFISLICKTSDSDKGICYLYMTDTGKVDHSLVIVRWMKRNINRLMEKLKVEVVLAPALLKFDRFMKYLGFEETEFMINGPHGKNMVYIKNGY